MEQKNLATVLRGEHKALVEEITKIKELANQQEVKAEDVLSELVNFKTALLAHLELEDKEFYPALLEKMEEKGKEIEKTKEFIGKMAGIASQVSAFLETYSNAERIADNVDHFRENLDKIISILGIRVEAEEDFVLTDWEYLMM